MVKKNTREAIDLADMEPEVRRIEKDRRREMHGFESSDTLQVNDVESSQEAPDA